MVPVTTIVLFPAALILEDDILKRLDVYLVGAQQAQELQGSQYLIGVVVSLLCGHVEDVIIQAWLNGLQLCLTVVQPFSQQILCFVFLFLCHCLRSL